MADPAAATVTDVAPRHVGAPSSSSPNPQSSSDQQSSSEPSGATPGGKPRWKLSWISVLVALIFLAGMSIFMYPSTAAWLSQYNQSKALREYAEVVVADPVPGNTIRLREAHEYNRQLNAGEIVVGAGERKPTTGGQAGEGSLNYYDMLSTGLSGIMARLKIPVINVDLPIYHGTSDETLEKGVGHLEGTSLPVGGEDTHTVLTAHRGLASATLFNDLYKLTEGDLFVIEVMDEVLTYKVIETQVVEPDHTQTLFPRAGKDLATLVTCTPLGINTHRILVTGERITPTPVEDLEKLGADPDIPGFPWWAVILPGGVILSAIYVWRSGYPPKPKESRKDEARS